MSDRSSFISDCLVYFGNRQQEVTQELIAYLAPISAKAVEIAPGKWAVAGYVNSGAPGCEFEAFAGGFHEDVSLVINCESGHVIRFNLKTGDFV